MRNRFVARQRYAFTVAAVAIATAASACGARSGLDELLSGEMAGGGFDGATVEPFDASGALVDHASASIDARGDVSTDAGGPHVDASSTRDAAFVVDASPDAAFVADASPDAAFVVDASPDAGSDSGDARSDASSADAEASTIPFAVDVRGDGSTMCALMSDGTVECRGLGGSGQLGDGIPNISTTPVRVVGITTAVAIDVADEHACAVLAEGTIACWGGNDDGDLGDGTTASSDVPVAVQGITNAKAVATGLVSACALLADGTVDCWGNLSQELLDAGLGGATPTRVPGITNAQAITVGEDSACALLASGLVVCWGSNDWGQLGDGTVTASATPVMVLGFGSATAVEVASDSACALLFDGSVRCWGFGANGELGNGAFTASSVSVPVSGLPSTATAIAVGSAHACALLADGTVDCWGYNGYGELGQGGASTLRMSALPVTVTGLTGMTRLAVTYAGACAKSSGDFMCWGEFYYGQSGDINSGTANASPIDVSW